MQSPDSREKPPALLRAFEGCPAKEEAHGGITEGFLKVREKGTPKDIREWAIAEGLEVSLRGRTSTEVRAGFP